MPVKTICQICKKEFLVKPYRIKEGCKFCSYKCYWQSKKGKPHLQRENHPRWKGGKTKDGGGYVLIRKPEHPFAQTNGYVSQHRLVMEKHLGRYLLPEEVVHHKNNTIHDNRIENLTLFDNKSKHQKYHRLSS
jgi:hypothetical protein